MRIKGILFLIIAFLLTAFTVFAQQRTYQIGSYGPAGGIVFYDKGVFSDGWRYLEAAPKDVEFTEIQWGAYLRSIDGTGTEIGTGKKNTQIIISFLKNIGETRRAAQVCASLHFGGFNDWFLPSVDELELMYRNLKQRGIGDFGNSWYWSSSQHNSGNARDVLFLGGNKGSNLKNSPVFVRAVRAF